MKIEFISKGYAAGEKLKDIIEKKSAKLDKFFVEPAKAKVVLKKTKDVETLEFTILLTGAIIRAEVSSDNMYDNIDEAIPKLEKQIIRHYAKLKSKKGRAKEFADLGAVEDKEPARSVVRSKTFDLVPMTVTDAIEELELVGHDFYVFLNKETGSTSVVYLRHDGDYGVIETRV